MPVEKSCTERARALLNSLPHDALVDLAKTVTNQRIQFVTDKEAVDAILDYSVSATELLYRRRMKVDYLFAYLINHCSANVAFKSRKDELVRKILDAWHVDNSSKAASHTTSETYTDEDSEESTDGNSKGQNEAANSESRSRSSDTSPEFQALAIGFLNWWYPLLKPLACASTIALPESVQFGPQHFFGDASFHLFCMSEDGSYSYEERFHSAIGVHQRLCEIISSLQLILNPNLTTPSSIKCFSDPYGLVFIGSLGTVFVLEKNPLTNQNEMTLAGVFEQSFGIVQDPRNDNNWVVKFSQLRLSIAPRFIARFSGFFSASQREISDSNVADENEQLAIMEM